MEAARLPRTPNPTGAVRFGLIGALLGLATVAWIATDLRMSGMDAGPGTELGSLGFFIGVWVVMMAAMMFPSVWPMVLTFRRVQADKARRGSGSVPAGTVLIITGYLLSWALAGALAYGIFTAFDSLSIAVLDWDRGGPYLAGGVIAAAALYQLTPFKDVCLRHCRNPLSYLMHHWRPGSSGALRMGVEHGAWCVGCCWMLMAALFALGIMSLGWMALIAALIATEKLLPWKVVANRGIAALLAVLAVGVAFFPGDLPGLTVPGSAASVEAMEAMGMEPAADGGAMPAMPAGEAMPEMAEEKAAPLKRGNDGMSGMEP